MYIEVLRNRLVLPIENFLNTLVSQKYNPFYYHGALPNVFLWSLIASGLLLFAYYQPTLASAYESVRFITFDLPFGNAMRSLHRYAADGMMIFIIIHMCRVWFTDRFREYRILPWITGIVLLIITFLIGLSGYLMIWDQEAVALTYATVNLLKQLPFLGEPLASFLLAGKLVTDYTLVRFLVMHLGIPVLMMFFLWMHYLRITRPVTTPPVALTIMLFGAMFLISGIAPVDLGAAPDLNNMSVQSIELDLLYAWPQALALFNGWSAGWVWILTLAVPVALLVLPYLQKKVLRGQFAKVSLQNCTGCSLCYHDCPYEAIQMVDRNDSSRFKRLAVVDPARCANCGLCVGACAFKAIDIPRRESPDVLDEIKAALAEMNSELTSAQPLS